MIPRAPEDKASGHRSASHSIQIWDVGKSMSAVLSAAADPLNPRCCAWCLAVFVFSLPDHARGVLTLQNHGHEVVRSCLLLITIYSEARCFLRIRGRLAQAQHGCAERGTRYKHRLHGDANDPFAILMTTLFRLLTLVLTRGENPVYTAARERQSFHRRNGCWPVCVRQLFPLGVRRTVAALVHWACVSPAESPMMVLAIYLGVARPVVFPALLESQCRDRVAWSVVQSLTQGRGVPWAGEPPFMLPPDLRGLFKARQGRGGIERTVGLLMNIRADVQARGDDAQRLFAGREAELLLALEDIPFPPVNTAKALDERDSSAMTYRGVQDYVCLLRTALDRETAGCAHPFDSYPKLAVVHEAALRALAGRWCSGPGCNKNEVCAEGVRRFLRCGCCRSVRYCSRECQSRGWTHGAHSHRNVCPALASLQQGGVMVTSDFDDFESSISEVAYDPKNIDILHEWAMGGGLVSKTRHT